MSDRFRIPRATQRLDLAGDWAGVWVEMVLNPPSRVADQLQAAGGQGTPDPAGFKSALAALLVGWNLEDEHGEPLPPTRAGLDAVPYALVGAIAEAWSAALTLPKSNGTSSAPPSGERDALPTGTPTWTGAGA